MRRLLLCLPLCLVLAPDTPPRTGTSAASPRPAVELKSDTLPVLDRAGLDKLAKSDPLAFLEAALRRHRKEVTAGYSLTLQRQERIAGKLQRSEVLDVVYRASPYSVRMEWKEGARRAQRILYVEGENNNKVVVRPTGTIASLVVLRLDPAGADVKDSSRYPPTEFGIESTMLKTLAAWQAAKKRGDLEVKLIATKKIPEAGDRLCWVFERTNYTQKEEEGIRRATFYFDCETGAQVGTVLRAEDDVLLGEYFFRDIRPLTEFDKDTFSPASL